MYLFKTSWQPFESMLATIRKVWNIVLVNMRKLFLVIFHNLMSFATILIALATFLMMTETIRLTDFTI